MSDPQAVIEMIMVCGVIFAPFWGALFAWLYGYSERRNRRADLQ